MVEGSAAIKVNLVRAHVGVWNIKDFPYQKDGSKLAEKWRKDQKTIQYISFKYTVKIWPDCFQSEVSVSGINFTDWPLEIVPLKKEKVINNVKRRMIETWCSRLKEPII